MKRKRTDWSKVPWTPFFEATEGDAIPAWAKSHRVVVNSRYQVAIWYEEHPVFGEVAHLSIKVHDRQAFHDWRDFQRIKNELCGPECEAVEIYPAESRLVDTANQYHLFVFRTWKIDLGFRERLVGGDGPPVGKARQRPFEPGTRPADAVTAGELDAQASAVVAGRGETWPFSAKNAAK